ncbi:MAG: hypothetical protein QOI66_4680 [Myxococcales bacterium]|nr:hypothetical protein [Myxococcales bacterium]
MNSPSRGDDIRIVNHALVPPVGTFALDAVPHLRRLQRPTRRRDRHRRGGDPSCLSLSGGAPDKIHSYLGKK